MFTSILDPDVSVLLPDGSRRPLMTFLLPSAAFMLAGIALVASIFLPYWRLTMTAPQYPKGLWVEVYVNQLAGDVDEVDALNHYLGMPKLDEGGQLERTIAIYAIGAVALLLLGALFVHNRWASLFALPVVAYPFVFLADLYYILYQYGHSIDPQSALGGAIEPFTPPLLGQGMVGQFGTLAEFQPGLYLAFLAASLAVVGLYLHRLAYRPVVEARKKAAMRAVKA